MKISIESNILKHLFRNVYFINGTAYAGKSTMVKLLAEKYNGICCGENYHSALTDAIDVEHQPNLSYFDTMKDWQEFVTRSPEEYDAWISGSSRESAELELAILIRVTQENRPVFVDTNISPEILKEISDYNHVAIMLSPQWMSVDLFFNRPDPEKQFIYRQLMAAPDPDWAMANYRRVLEKLNSREKYDAFANSGFFVLERTPERTIEQALSALETHFGLKERNET